MSKEVWHTALTNFGYNCMTLIKSFSIKRDRNVWLFGAWMGERFADNSRFLFQYLSANKDLYGIKEVIWVSRNSDVVNQVRDMGYEAYLIGSEESTYYHYRAGVHVICNSDSRDIDTQYSFGAIKIQLWHGNGIKASGKMKRRNKPTLKEAFWDYVVKPITIPGGWYNAYWVACSEESKRVLVNDSGANPNKIIIANSPRLCKCIKYTEAERCVLNLISDQKSKGKKIVLFLPTFRNNDSSYIAPLDIPGFYDFIHDRNILWIQKNHSADTQDTVRQILAENVVNLNRDFDVNVLYDSIDIFISDYSSATTDAIYKNLVTIEYCPDYDEYAKYDRGFVSDFSNYHVGNFVKEPSRLTDMIDQCLGKCSDDYPRHQVVRRFLFDSNIADYSLICQSIISTIR